MEGHGSEFLLSFPCDAWEVNGLWLGRAGWEQWWPEMLRAGQGGGSWAGKAASPSPSQATPAGCGPPCLDVPLSTPPLLSVFLFWPLKQPWAPPQGSAPGAGVAAGGRWGGRQREALTGQDIRHHHDHPTPGIWLWVEGRWSLPRNRRLAIKSLAPTPALIRGCLRWVGAKGRAWEAGREQRAAGLSEGRTLPPSVPVSAFPQGKGDPGGNGRPCLGRGGRTCVR